MQKHNSSNPLPPPRDSSRTTTQAPRALDQSQSPGIESPGEKKYKPEMEKFNSPKNARVSHALDAPVIITNWTHNRAGVKKYKVTNVP